MEQNKIQSEPFFNSLFEKYELETIKEWGFFFDTLKAPIDFEKEVNIPCTPVNFIKENYHRLDRINSIIDTPTGKAKRCVIVSSGAHCPMHAGHIEMMCVARNVLKSKGYNVIGGYLSPGHDDYIAEKTGKDMITVEDRLNIATDVIGNESWLSLDPWEARFTSGSVNFTTVIYRISKYLERWVGPDIKVFYVCGSDNALHANAFKEADQDKFGCVIVNRPGHERSVTGIEALQATCTLKISSTELRQNGFKFELPKKQLFLRMKWTHVEKCVMAILRKHFIAVWPIDINDQNQMFRLNVDKSMSIINLDEELDHSTYNSDALVLTNFQKIQDLRISRLYDFMGYRGIKFINRPGTPSIETQVANLDREKTKDGVYIFDDDIQGGSTIKFVTEQLANVQIKVNGRFCFVSTKDELTETLDSRDFILGDGGSVVEMDNERVRVPYIYPFISPRVRASIGDAMAFSIDIWKINVDHYSKLQLKIKDLKQLSWLTKLGFSENDLIADVCAYYLNYLKTKYEKVELSCMVCNKSFMGPEPLMCCSGRDCGCIGMPVDPIVCSEECYDKLINKQ